MVPPGEVTGGIRGGRPRMGGDRTPKPPVARSAKAKKRVLFVCIGNACRSQMAEAFARAYGSDILTVRSAGLAPAARCPAAHPADAHRKKHSLRRTVSQGHWIPSRGNRLMSWSI